MTVIMQRPATPSYVLRESTRIHALESTVECMASDLSTSKDQLREVKELLLRLINPNTTPTEAVANKTANHTESHSSGGPVQAGELLHRCEPAASSHLYSGTQTTHFDTPQHHVPPVWYTAPTAPVALDAIEVHTGVTLSPSCASGDTVPVTPNSLLQKFTNSMPIGRAVSTDVSHSAGTTSIEVSPHPRNVQSPSSQRQHLAHQTSGEGTHSEPDVQDGVTTRGMAITIVPPPNRREPRQKFQLTLLPRFSSEGPVAVNKLCFILHPEHGNSIVAEGRTGGSWKSHSGKYGSLCSEGEQMVQIHRINKVGVPLIFIEERQPFSILEHAIVKPTGSSVYVIWLTKLLIKKKIDPAPRAT